ncbi:peptide chain release factor-like protein [bacterium E08(2017)]|nr:peptide chain release factor-like protein [bacterium E08(2017)]
MPEEYVSSTKQKHLEERMKKLGVDEADCTEKFVLGGGRGGQKVNKTASCVYLKHGPSSIEIKCQKTRSRAKNRFYARRELCDQLEERELGEKSARRQTAEKIRRQKRRRSRRQKQRMLDAKRKQSEKKILRKPVRENE